MKTFIACLAAIGVWRLFHFAAEVDSTNRALRRNGAWFAFEIGTTVDARRLIEGDLSLEAWEERQARRERELRDAR